jgi:hypothetical protein
MVEQAAIVELKIIQAADAMRRERAASPAFRAALEELERKAERLSELLDESGDPEDVRQALAELEEAGHIARAAAEAESGLAEETRVAARSAYQAIDELAGAGRTHATGS